MNGRDFIASGWGTAGGGYGYRPYAQTAYPTSYNPLPKLLQARSDEAAGIFKAKMEAGAARVVSLHTTVPLAYRVLDHATDSSSTLAERDHKLRAFLGPAADVVYKRAKDLLQNGRVLTDRDAMAVAIAEEVPTKLVGPSGEPISSATFWKWAGIALVAFLVLR
jgi:hypothetical protein